MKIPVGIVDDRSQNLHLFSERLNYSDDIAIVLTAGGGKDFLDQLKKLPAADQPKVILMDIEMPDMDGIEAVRTGKLLYPHIHFLMLTVFDDDDKLFEAIKAGADGYLLKNEKLANIIDCVVQLAETGSAPMSPHIARKTLDLLMKASFPAERPGTPETPETSETPGTPDTQEKREHSLSHREIEILKLTVDGYAYKAIAEKLFLSSHTVRKHLANIYNKLHVSSKAQAIKIATKNRLI